VNNADKWFEIDGAWVARETSKAFLVQFGCEEDRPERWVPKSQIDGPENWQESDVGPMLVTRWWARTVGLLNDRPDIPNRYQNNPPRKVVPINLRRSKEVYHGLAQRFHPDRNSQGGAVMAAINQLWQAVAADLGLRL
jgi:hypothetical protein